MIRLSASVVPAEPETGSNVTLRMYVTDSLTGLPVTLTTDPLLSVQPPVGASTSGLTGTFNSAEGCWYYLLDVIHSDVGLWLWTWTAQDPNTNDPAQTSGFFIARDSSGV